MKKKWIILVSIILLVVVVAVILFISLMKTESPKDLRNVVGKEVLLSEGIMYCDNVSSDNLEDDFSKVYSGTVKFNVESIDETTMEAKVNISAPPLKEILESCLPEDSSGDFESVFKKYMDDVYEAIDNYSVEKMISTTVVCKIIDDNGLKIVPNNDFTDALFPDVQQLLSDVILEMLVSKES